MGTIKSGGVETLPRLMKRLDACMQGRIGFTHRPDDEQEMAAWIEKWNEWLNIM
jgi:hypothetical protein